MKFRSRLFTAHELTNEGSDRGQRDLSVWRCRLHRGLHCAAVPQPLMPSLSFPPELLAIIVEGLCRPVNYPPGGNAVTHSASCHFMNGCDPGATQKPPVAKNPSLQRYWSAAPIPSFRAAACGPERRSAPVPTWSRLVSWRTGQRSGQTGVHAPKRSFHFNNAKRGLARRCEGFCDIEYRSIFVLYTYYSSSQFLCDHRCWNYHWPCLPARHARLVRAQE